MAWPGMASPRWLPRPPRCSPAHQQGGPHHGAPSCADLDGPGAACTFASRPHPHCCAATLPVMPTWSCPRGGSRLLHPGSLRAARSAATLFVVSRSHVQPLILPGTWAVRHGGWTRWERAERAVPGVGPRGKRLQPVSVGCLHGKSITSMKTPRAGRVREETDKGTCFVLIIYPQALLCCTLHHARCDIITPRALHFLARQWGNARACTSRSLESPRV